MELLSIKSIVAGNILFFIILLTPSTAASSESKYPIIVLRASGRGINLSSASTTTARVPSLPIIS